LVSGAYCLAAIGEWERAAVTLRPLLASGRQGPATLQAQLLDACLKAWSAPGGGAISNGDSSALTALAANPEFAALRPMIYYTLWQTLSRNSNAGEEWKSRLLAEFPQSPEARAANPNKQKDSPSISVVQSPLWILFPGAAGSAPAATVRPTAPVATTTPSTPPPPSSAAPARPSTATPTTPATPAAPVPAQSATSTPATSAPAPVTSAVVLQTGVFSREANARAQIEILQKAGFAATTSRKMVNGAEHWAVVVPAGQDSNKTAADLKKAGFDSFPVKL
jgi:cell division septation protein DedD